MQSMGSPRVGRDFTFTFHFHALEKEMATHSGVLAWRLPGTGEPGGLASMGSHRVGHDRSDLAAAAAANIVEEKYFWFAKILVMLSQNEMMKVLQNGLCLVLFTRIETFL